MKPESPWEGLSIPPVGNLEARRADATHPHAFFYARDSQGDFLFTLQVNCMADEVDGIPRIRGVEVIWLPMFGRLQLRLHAASDRDMFAVLCHDLLAFTHKSRSDRECVERMLARLSRWQRLLSRGHTKILDDEQIRGLAAELLFLRDELIPRLGTASVLAWKGPHGFPQDFAIDSLAVEVKSHLVGAPDQVRISSPEQLHIEGAALYLRVQRLAIASTGGFDLASLVGEISEKLTDDPAALMSFEISLGEIGYHDAPEYADYRLSAEGWNTYLVVGDFPRIVPQDVSHGVCNVTYSIRLSALKIYSAEINWHAEGKCQ